MIKSMVVVHCSAAPFGDRASIDRGHRDRHFIEIGYTAVALNGHRDETGYRPQDDGLIEPGRDLDKDGDLEEELGAHAEGFNRYALGICLVGPRADEGQPPFPKRQLASAARLVAEWCRRFGLDPLEEVGGGAAEQARRLGLPPPLQVSGHREMPDPKRPGRYVAKLCPVIDMDEFRRQVVIAGSPGGVTIWEV